MADTRCYKNSTVNGEWSLKDVSEDNSICPGTQKDDGFSRCCGKSAICLPHSICQALNAAEGSSGFYVGSCTDRDYNSPACSNFCSGVANPDIVYNATAARWQCCGRDANGRTKCNDPTTRKSKAPAPTVLLENYSASGSTFTASSTLTSPSASSSIATPTTSPEPESGGLSTGAKVGAGIGGAIGGLLVIALIIFLLKWKRKPTTAQSLNQRHEAGHEFHDVPKHDVYVASPSQSPGYRMPTKSYIPPAELSPQGAGSMRTELPASGHQRAQAPQELPS